MINRLPVETYACVSCNKSYEDFEILKTWKCPKCNEYIHVYAEAPDDPDVHFTIIRKRADEVKFGDLVLLPGMLDEDPHLVIGVSKYAKKIGIGLKGYGQYKLGPEQGVNCLIGSW